VTIKSGHGFHESYHDVYINKAYQMEIGSARIGVVSRNTLLRKLRKQMHPPRYWEYTKSPWHFGLLIKNFVVIHSLHYMVLLSCLILTMLRSRAQNSGARKKSYCGRNRIMPTGEKGSTAFHYHCKRKKIFILVLGIRQCSTECCSERQWQRQI
jgi:hypothetical protein